MTTPSKGQLYYLLIGLLVFLLIAPVINEITGSSLVNELAFFAMIVISVWSLGEHRRGFIIGVGLAVFSLAITGINIVIDLAMIHILNIIVVLLFCLLSISIVANKVLLDKNIDVNTLIGSACIYLLIGIIWGLLYSIVEYITPGAFHGINTLHINDQLWEFIYYSFVTITTLGYGDMYPLSSFARSLAYLEAICGQLYIALLVATLVGRYLSRQGNSD